MGLRFDYAASILLCAEENNSILDFDDAENENDEETEANFGKRSNFYANLLVGFPVQSEESLSLMIEKEREFLPRDDYVKRLMDGDLDVSIRNDAIDWISKVQAQYNFGPLTAWLSINYLDRFLSQYKLPKGKAWMTQLLSVACLALAAKLEETEVPLLTDLQVGKAKYVFEAKTIQRMEILVLGTLKWRMQAVTPFSFLDYFIDKFNNGNFETLSLISSAIELVLILIRGIVLLEYKPSEIAAAVALVLVKEIQEVDADKYFTGCIHVEKRRVFRCYDLIREITLNKIVVLKDSKISVLSSVPQSPIGVLDIPSLSDMSADISTIGSQPDCSNSPAAKKRKL